MKRYPTDYDRDLGLRIREARLAAELTLTETAELLGCSYQQLQKYEKGRNRVPVARLERLVSITCRPLTWFIPTATEVRPVGEAWLSQFLANRRCREQGKLFVQLSEEEQDFVLFVTKHCSTRKSETDNAS